MCDGERGGRNRVSLNMGHWYFDSGNSLTVDLYPISDERVYEDRRERERESS